MIKQFQVWMALCFVLMLPGYGQIISMQPLDASVCHGDTAFFSVTLDTTTRPANFYWLRWQYRIANLWVDIPNQGGNGAQVFNSATHPGLTFTLKIFSGSVFYQQGGQFRCVVDQVGSFLGAPTNEASIRATLTLNLPPVIGLSSNAPVCTGDSIKIESLVSGGVPPYLYTWIGPTGSVSIFPNLVIPNASLSDQGDYDLQVIDGGGCVAMVKINIQVRQGPAFVSAVPDQTVCKGEPVSFCASATGSAGGLTYSWARRDASGWNLVATGSSCLSIFAGQNGNTNGKRYIALAEDINGCRDTSNIGTLYVSEANATISNVPVSVCDKEVNVPFCLDSTFSSYFWSVNGASFADRGRCIDLHFDKGTTQADISVVVTNFLGCVDSASGSVAINLLPIANNIKDYILCESIPGSGEALFDLSAKEADILDGNTQMVTVDWIDENKIPIPDPSAFVSPATTVFATVTDPATGCSSETELVLVVKILPVIDFTYEKVCMGLETPFANVSTGTGLTYEWDFGDGNGATLSAPFHRYDLSGEYEVTLIGTNGFCSDTAFESIVVLPSPEALAMPVEVCYSLSSFIDASGSDNDKATPGIDNTGLAYTWTFEDDGEIFAKNEPDFEHIFQERKAFHEATLTVENQEGCRDTTSILIPLDLCGPPAPVLDVLRKTGDLGAVLIAEVPGVANETLDFVWYDAQNGSPADTLSDQSYFFIPDHNQRANYVVTVAYKKNACSCVTQSRRLANQLSALDTALGLIASPNPNTGQFVLDVTYAGEGMVSVEILNMLGARVYRESVLKTQDRFHHFVHTELPAGLYSIKLNRGHGNPFFTYLIIY